MTTRAVPSSQLHASPRKGGIILAIIAIGQQPVPCLFAISLLFFIAVEHTLHMVPPSAPPKDIGFLLTAQLHSLLSTMPALNSFLAALNTVFVGMQAIYIVWALLVEGRSRPTIAALFMFACRGVMGYCTQLPLPHEFLGSAADFPVGNASFFLFFSGHVAGAVIASLDMRRMRRRRLSVAFDSLNALQALRLLATRGHYTIDLAVGLGAGFFFDTLSGKYEDRNIGLVPSDFQRADRSCCTCTCR